MLYLCYCYCSWWFSSAAVLLLSPVSYSLFFPFFPIWASFFHELLRPSTFNRPSFVITIQTSPNMWKKRKIDVCYFLCSFFNASHSCDELWVSECEPLSVLLSKHTNHSILLLLFLFRYRHITGTCTLCVCQWWIHGLGTTTPKRCLCCFVFSLSHSLSLSLYVVYFCVVCIVSVRLAFYSIVFTQFSGVLLLSIRSHSPLVLSLVPFFLVCCLCCCCFQVCVSIGYFDGVSSAYLFIRSFAHSLLVLFCCLLRLFVSLSFSHIILCSLFTVIFFSLHCVSFSISPRSVKKPKYFQLFHFVGNMFLWMPNIQTNKDTNNRIEQQHGSRKNIHKKSTHRIPKRNWAKQRECNDHHHHFTVWFTWSIIIQQYQFLNFVY